MKRGWLVPVLVLVLFLLTCCGRPYDKKGLRQVEEYLADISAAVDTAVHDIKLAETDLKNQLFLFQVEQHVIKLKSINGRRLTAEFPGESEISNWNFERSRGDERWDVAGEELAAAIGRVISSSDNFICALELIKSLEGDLSDSDYQWVWRVIEEVNYRIDKLWWILYRGP